MADFVIPFTEVTDYICDGTQFTFQPKIYSFTVKTWRSVKSLSVKVKGACDDACRIELGDGTLVGDNLFVFRRADGSFYDKFAQSEEERNYTIPFRMQNNTLEVKIGARNIFPDQCYVTNLRWSLILSSK